jgi:hypothetical protein
MCGNLLYALLSVWINLRFHHTSLNVFLNIRLFTRQKSYIGIKYVCHWTLASNGLTSLKLLTLRMILRGIKVGSHLQRYLVPWRRTVASDWHDTELRSELSSRASWRNGILRALHHAVPSLLRKPEASWMWRKRGERTLVTCHVARPDLLRP